MRYVVLFACLVLMPGPSVSIAQPHSLFVSPAWLADRLDAPNVVMFHIGVKAEYDTAHIAGAQFLDISEISVRSPQRSLEMPAIEVLDSVFEARGISDKSIVILYFGKDWVTPTARVYVTLDYVGLGDRTYILNGGLPAWIAAGYPVTTAIPVIRQGLMTPHLGDQVLIETDRLSSRLGDSRVSIIDARDIEFYQGTDPGSGVRAGHIPGAVSIPYSTVLDSLLRTKDLASLRQLFTEAGVKTGGEVVTYCHVGQQASLLYVAAKELGYIPHLYDGSFQAWSREPSLPVDRPMEQWLPRLISTGELEERLGRGDLSLIDLRSDLPAYLKGHIPGAVYVHLESLRASGYGVPTDVLSPEGYASLLSQLGIRLDRPVVIYSSAEGVHFTATYLAWLLLGFGHQQISILDGGFEKWTAEGRTISMSYPDISPSQFPSSPSTLQRARLAQVRWIEEQKTGILVDARSPAQFEGREGPQMRLGHIPGAINHFWKTDLVRRDSLTVWRDLEELRESYQRQGITPEQRIVVYCNSGAEASHVFFTLYCLLRYPNVRVYVPSYTEWAERDELPIETARQ